VDSGGAASAPEGLDLSSLIQAKREGRSVGTLPGAHPGMGGLELLETIEADVLLEASPTNYQDGEPGLSLVRGALSKGLHAVLASKGPLVLAFPELAALSDWSQPARPRLRFGATTCGALPTLSMGRRDLAGARILHVEGILNLTSQVILGLMAEGRDLVHAVSEAQRLGLAETDPSLDLEGWDAAAKLVIVANAVLDIPARLEDVSIRGITGLDPAEVRTARLQGIRYALLAVAERTEGGYRLRVGPAGLPPDHPFARLEDDEGAILYEADIYGRMIATLARQGPLGTAAAMLRDLIEIAGN
jgi:homoserine dehydrogenase